MLSSDNSDNSNILPLSYGLGLLKQLLPFPSHIFKADNHYFEKFNNEDPDTWNVLKTDYEFRCSLLKQINEKKVVIITDEKPIVYGGVQCTDSLYMIIGPVSIIEVDQSFCKLYALKHKAENMTPFCCTLNKLAAVLLLVHSSVTGEYMYLSDFMDSTALNDDLIKNINRQMARVFSEQSMTVNTHNPALFEDSIKNAIKTGDVEALKKAINSIYSSMRGTLSRNSLRSAKNLAIVDITIATRAAIDVGLSVEEMYTISDAFIMEVEDCKYDSDALALAHACALRCTQKVEKYLSSKFENEAPTLVVSKARQYIDHNLNRKFDMQQMCQKIKVSPGYLSRQFKKEMQMTVGDYIRMRKVEMSKLLLTTSDKSIAEIAGLLGFTSQSHFGRVFLKNTGMTPAAYKREAGVSDMVI